MQENPSALVEEMRHKHGVEQPLQMTIYFSTRMDSLTALYPELEELGGLSDETRVVVSEPLGDLAGAWSS